jgi:hypothetical protein
MHVKGLPDASVRLYRNQQCTTGDFCVNSSSLPSTWRAIQNVGLGKRYAVHPGQGEMFLMRALEAWRGTTIIGNGGARFMRVHRGVCGSGSGAPRPCMRKVRRIN